MAVRRVRGFEASWRGVLGKHVAAPQRREQAGEAARGGVVKVKEVGVRLLALQYALEMARRRASEGLGKCHDNAELGRGLG